MGRFRNEGWVYFEQLQEIMPNATARGSHAFSPMNTAPPKQLLVEDEAEEGAAPVETTGHVDTVRGHPMDVDQDGDGSTLVSTSTTKRKLATLASEEDDTVSFSSGNPVVSSFNVSASSIPSTVPSSEPSRKKSSPSIATSSKKKSKAPSSLPSKATSAASSGRGRGRTSTSTKLSSELLVHEVQGTINQLTATVRDSIDADPVTRVRQDAVRRAMQESEGLTDAQKKVVVNRFTTSHASAQVYLALDDDDFRRSWLQDICNEN